MNFVVHSFRCDWKVRQRGFGGCLIRVACEWATNLGVLKRKVWFWVFARGERRIDAGKRSPPALKAVTTSSTQRCKPAQPISMLCKFPMANSTFSQQEFHGLPRCLVATR